MSPPRLPQFLVVTVPEMFPPIQRIENQKADKENSLRSVTSQAVFLLVKPSPHRRHSGHKHNDMKRTLYSFVYTVNILS